ncbi:MAG: hypothetical protein ABEK29_02325 [Bradymonadaceae bacterium]
MAPLSARAVPSYSLISGSPCSTCHTNAQGGGMRTSIGWAKAKSTGAFSWEDLGVSLLADRTSNEIVDGVSAGIDTRIQVARLGRPRVRRDEAGEPKVVAPPRQVIPMQIEPYVRAELLDWLALEGSWSPGPTTFSQADFCSSTFAGQSCFTAQVSVEPDPPWPTVRVGVLQPSFGIRRDDHTNLIRHDAARGGGDRTTLIPPNYAEPAAEATIQPVHWFSANASGFLAWNLSKAVGDSSVLAHPSFGGSTRVLFSPRIDTDNLGSFTFRIGASALSAGRFAMVNGFFGIGWLDRASILTEAALLGFGGDQQRRAWNLSTKLSVPIRDWLVVHGRFDQSTGRIAEGAPRVYSVTAGVKFHPLPWIELRPEYRYYRTDDWQMGQYTAQLHLFY